MTPQDTPPPLDLEAIKQCIATLRSGNWPVAAGCMTVLVREVEHLQAEIERLRAEPTHKHWCAVNAENHKDYLCDCREEEK